ncbi:MAG: hypothetical protein JJU09_09860 [Rhodobacteraceae bacterium]|nr:hypothetical protein [Paracoccaceae bacterium]MCC5966634.1 hypothetical protein [Natronohydrobacter sp.]
MSTRWHGRRSGRARQTVASPRAVRVMDRLGGGALIGAGILTARTA